MKQEIEAVIIEEGEKFVEKTEKMLRITRSLKRCLEYNQRDPARGQGGVIRAFKAAKERVQNL